MATKPLVMLDDIYEDVLDDENIDDNEFVTFVMSTECVQVRNIISIPKDQALSFITNMLIQLEISNGPS